MADKVAWHLNILLMRYLVSARGKPVSFDFFAVHEIFSFLPLRNHMSVATSFSCSCIEIVKASGSSHCCIPKLFNLSGFRRIHSLASISFYGNLFSLALFLLRFQYYYCHPSLDIKVPSYLIKMLIMDTHNFCPFPIHNSTPFASLYFLQYHRCISNSLCILCLST